MKPLDPGVRGGLRFAPQVAGFTKKIAVLALVATAACTEGSPTLSPPFDSFYFPTGITLRHLPDGRTVLVVVSSNFNLRYDLAGGGTVIAVDPDASANALPACSDPAACPKCTDPAACPLNVLGSFQIGSFGGEVDFADEGNCPQLFETPSAGQNDPLPAGSAKVLVSSRSAYTLYRMDMDPAGALSCGSDCPYLFGNNLYDPYGTTVVCRDFGDRKASVFVTHLRAPNYLAELSELDLRQQSGGWIGHLFAVDPYGPAHTATLQKLDSYRRLLVTSLFSTVGNTLVRWVDLTAPLATGSTTIPDVYAVEAPPLDLYSQVGGSLARGIAMSSDGKRAYTTFAIYDQDQALRYGRIVVLSAVLAIVDVEPDANGMPNGTVLKILPLGAGASNLRVISRPDPATPGKFLPDLVAITETSDGSLEIYDDGVGAIVRNFGIDQATGEPVVGKEPFGLAVEERPAANCLLPGLAAPTCQRIYVSSFASGWVSAVELDPSLPSRAEIVKRIGAEQPQ